MKKIHLIGEIGINHNGSVSSKKLIAQAKTGLTLSNFKKELEICVPDEKKIF